MACKPFDGHIRKNGYGQLYHKPTKKYQYAHRVAYMEAYGPIPEGLVVRHKCDNPSCVNPEHLELGTQTDNMQDAVKRGRSAAGMRNGMAKLTPEDAERIRFIIASKEVSQRALAREYKVSPQTINNIVHGRHWQ